jgi:hypothetical protein
MSKSSKILGLVVLAASVAVGTGTAYAEDGHGHRLPTYLMRTLSAPAQDSGSPGNMWAGSGLPATKFILRENLDEGVELAIKAHYRQGHDILPTYIDGKGRVHVNVPTGPQVVDPAHGVPVAHPGRAAWNFAYSVNTALPGARPSLDNYEGELWIDLDPSTKTDYLKLKLTKLGPPAAFPSQVNGYGWKFGSTTVIPDDEGTSRVTQNSQNIIFYAALIDTDKNAPGIQPYTLGPAEFDVKLILREKKNKHGHGHGGKEVARLHVVFNVVAP